MALKACRECRKKVSSEADQCPHCGVPSPTVYPERQSGGSSGGAWAAVLAGLAAVLLLAICSGPETSGTGGVVDVDSYDTHQPPREEPMEEAAVEVRVSLPEIAGQSPDSVASVVGPPDSTTLELVDGRRYPKHFHGDLLEVVYVEGQAEWITVWGGDVPFSEDALVAFGFERQRPTFANPDFVYRWRSLPGVMELSIFPGQAGKVFYAYAVVSRSI